METNNGKKYIFTRENFTIILHLIFDNLEVFLSFHKCKERRKILGEEHRSLLTRHF